MLTTFFCLVVAAHASAASLKHARDSFNPSTYAKEDVIERDFAIIGGGAAGTFAALNLAKKNKSIVLVEARDRLGGNTRTFHDPAAGVYVDFGVQVHLDDSTVRDFFDSLDVPLAAPTANQWGTSAYYDFAKRVALPSFTRGSIGDDYIAQLDKYSCVQDLNGLPSSVPENLLLTWPEYVEKNNLSESSAKGGLSWPATPSNLLDATALAVLNDGNFIEIAEFSGSGVYSAAHDNSAIFVNALAQLNPHVLLESRITAAQRSLSRNDSVLLVAQTPSGQKLIRAKQLILAMPPILDNTQYFDLDKTEMSILSNLSGKHYYGGVVNNTGLDDSIAYTNAGVDTLYNVANVPGIVEVAASAFAGYHFYWYNSIEATTQDTVEEAARSTIKWLQTQTDASDVEPTFLDYQDFSPFHLAPPTEDIANGWYGKMKGLQGYRNTWYISSLFVVGATQIWNNTLNILPDIIQAADLFN
ncbi:amine oxidase flavin-containing superfamily [Grosmannia clavigera kw1407]|uniref:Amine oxidase flavin-containing superfamily n=1 Tax=Grosmannia clavigera (strain kw1407 / UAMH 11150) TaxID=655863 RepID=F0XBR3_GROCL|nr:amine oxidase flavin-containing superfamily [Grosmannia clavigera kw1407]EFX04929.1 amine oxidase flavin-containing superfamily [Grosmannia clavigera kw1407]